MNNSDINELARQLREAAGEVSPQNIDSAQAVSDTDGYIECPHCSGEGAVNLEADYCNYDELPIGVQFYGIGTGVGAAERYFRAASPNNITAILDALEAAQQYAKSRDEENQGLMLTIGRLRVEREQLEASQPVVPEGYCLMPLSLTAENGAKNALNGEFHTIEHIGCVVCGGDGIDGDDECDNCNGSGDVVVQAPVSWTTIKDIYKAAVKCCAIQSFGNSEQLKAPVVPDAMPMQPIIVDEYGTYRFKANAIVNKLQEVASSAGYDLHAACRDNYSDEEWMQLAQLIGYSITGYSELSYVSDESYSRALSAAPALQESK